MPTIKDIARELNLNYSTVSLALRDSPKIKKQTAEKIKKKAEEMGYRPNIIARSLVLQKSKLVAMITPDISNPYYARVVEGAEAACQKAGYNMLICNTNWKPELEENHLNLILERRIDGAIISPCNVKNPLLEKILSEDFPITFVSSSYPYQSESKELFVGADNEQGGYLAAAHGLERNPAKIGIIGGSLNSQSLKDRITGYQRAFDEKGYEDRRVVSYYGEFTQESGYTNTLRALDENNNLECLLCLNDLIALGAMKAVWEIGRRIPEDISIIGFDDTYLADLYTVSLTSVYQPKYKIGYGAMKLLLESLTNSEFNRPHREILPCVLRKRGTS